jgi:hypothetical protein
MGGPLPRSHFVGSTGDRFIAKGSSTKHLVCYIDEKEGNTGIPVVPNRISVLPKALGVGEKRTHLPGLYVFPSPFTTISR